MNITDSPYKSLDAMLGTRFIGRNLLYFPRVTSTMDIALQAARKDAPEGTVVIAGEQTVGRGRSHRTWLTPPDNIALSVILYPEVPQLPYLVMITSLAVVYCIESVVGLKAGIKWPNDILIDGKKVCGILIENEISRDKKVRAVIGIGINIDIGQTVIEGSALLATGLETEAGVAIDKAALVESLLTEIERLYLRLPDGGAIFRDWESRLITLGKRVVVTNGNRVMEGIADSVDETGAIRLLLDDGSVARVIGGDVTLRQK
jgi:BirA family biotin operon repressor/biotin-[acetyl-CoA-carboxylase] ligase